MRPIDKRNFKPALDACEPRVLLSVGELTPGVRWAADHLTIGLQIAQIVAFRQHWRLTHHQLHAPVFKRHHRGQNGPPPASSTAPINSSPVAQDPVPAPPAAPPPVASTPVTVPPVPSVMSAMEQQIVTLTNQDRAANGLAPLSVDTKLVQMAEIHSRDMVQFGDMAHTLPEAALPALSDRANYVGYNASWLGENIAYGYPDASSVMQAWMGSPPHEANILNPNYTEIGVAIAYDSAGEPYFTQVFGRPA